MTDDRARPLPPCGIYRTTLRLGDIPAGRLVSFHNHGNPDPGVYLPLGWRHGRAVFDTRGAPLPGAWWAATLDPLAPEGFYRVREPFPCCEKRCRMYEPDQLVQLGYDPEGRPLLFVPELVDDALVWPAAGSLLDRPLLAKLAPLKVAASVSAPPEP